MGMTERRARPVGRAAGYSYQRNSSAEQAAAAGGVVSWFDAESRLPGSCRRFRHPGRRDLFVKAARPYGRDHAAHRDGIRQRVRRSDAHSRDVIHCSINTLMPWCMIPGNREFGTIVAPAGGVTAVQQPGE